MPKKQSAVYTVDCPKLTFVTCDLTEICKLRRFITGCKKALKALHLIPFPIVACILQNPKINIYRLVD